jgi:hypothetical protein
VREPFAQQYSTSLEAHTPLQSMALNTDDIELGRGMCGFLHLHKKLLCKTGATLMTVCLTLGLIMSQSLPNQFHKGSRILSADDKPIKVVPNPQSWGLPRPTENVSNPKQFAPLPTFGTLPPRSYKVNSLCTCNFSPNKLYMIARQAAKREGYTWSQGGAWVWRGQPCSCMPASNFRLRTAENAVIHCSFVYESDRRNVIDCSGEEFVYSSASNLAGYYECNGNPTRCVNTGYCEGNVCTPRPSGLR